MRPLRIGRASGSCRLTSRVAPSGIYPASRDRAWAATVAVRSMVTDRSPSARRSRPRIRRPGQRPLPVAQHCGCLRRGGLRQFGQVPRRPADRLGTFLPAQPGRVRIVAAISRARRVATRRQEIESLTSAHKLS
jgi:hypothetical protein